MSALLHFERRLAAAWPPSAWQDVSVLVAVSGGPDSVALLRALCRLKQEHRAGAGNLTVGHVNHRLRADADQDEAFISDLAQRLGIGCECRRLEPAALDLRDGLEAAARAARYDQLLQMAQRHGARYVVTAHTADDQAETILHRIARGTGLAGLAGIRRARALSPAVTLLRPMLQIPRAEVLAYLGELGQDYCVDVTNDEMHFTRNRIRRDVLPLLEKEVNSQIKQALLRLGSLAGEAQEVIDTLSEELSARAVCADPAGRVSLDCRLVRQAPRYLVRDLFARLWRTQGWPQQAMGYEDWDRLAAMVIMPQADKIQQVMPGQIIVRREGEKILLEKRTCGIS
jgi:tRNA(Ile)-lysidine synthase